MRKIIGLEPQNCRKNLRSPMGCKISCKLTRNIKRNTKISISRILGGKNHLKYNLFAAKIIIFVLRDSIQKALPSPSYKHIPQLMTSHNAYSCTGAIKTLQTIKLKSALLMLEAVPLFHTFFLSCICSRIEAVHAVRVHALTHTAFYSYYQDFHLSRLPLVLY